MAIKDRLTEHFRALAEQQQLSLRIREEQEITQKARLKTLEELHRKQVDILEQFTSDSHLAQMLAESASYLKGKLKSELLEEQHFPERPGWREGTQKMQIRHELRWGNDNVMRALIDVDGDIEVSHQPKLHLNEWRQNPELIEIALVKGIEASSHRYSDPRSNDDAKPWW